MEKSMETLYKGKFSLWSQMTFFFLVNLIALGLGKVLQMDTNTTWVIFQSILFFFSTASITIGVFSQNNPVLYYPGIIILFIIFFTLSKKIPTWLTGSSALEMSNIKFFALLNILFFVIFLLASLIYRGAKQAFEKM